MKTNETKSYSFHLLSSLALLVFIQPSSNAFAPFSTLSFQPSIQLPPLLASSSKSTSQFLSKSSPTISPKQDNTFTMENFCPKKAASADTEAYISSVLATKSSINIFGYGSLCWNPGSPDQTLAKSHMGVTSSVGRVIGWRRCWCQESSDHRGTKDFPGFVCTLLNDAEIAEISKAHMDNLGKLHGLDRKADPIMDNEVSVTKGLIFTVPQELVEDCLAELDFRESGGYARDVIDVIEESTGQTVKALLYRGTPQNPCFSPRALFDPIFGAARIAVSVGASGRNDEYLYNLDTFLASVGTSLLNSSLEMTTISAYNDIRERGDITVELASLTRDFQKNYHMYFLHGGGSNQFDQLLLDYASRQGNAPNLMGDEAHDLKEIVIALSNSETSDSGESSQPIVRYLFAGGGHSALLTEQGDFHLWGSNEQGQLGCTSESQMDSIPLIPPLKVKVEYAALGHNHTLVIEKETGNLYCFGENRRGQVTGIPMTPEFLAEPFKIEVGEKVTHVSCGVFHSAAITVSGTLITFGCTRFNQSISIREESMSADGVKYPFIGRWMPGDGSRLVKVSCGHRHTLALDEHGRVWSLGNNKYGQLGRRETERTEEPGLVSGYLGQKGSGCIDIDCGWSHNIALVQSIESEIVIYGWGRNDKSQLGIDCEDKFFDEPRLLYKHLQGKTIKSTTCGAESIMLQDEDGQIYGSGWNEHGNLSTGDAVNVQEIRKLSGDVRRGVPDLLDNGDNRNLVLAAGGAHFLLMRT